MSIRRGQYGEKVAVWYLKNKRYHIITTHFTCAFGEIDIIAQDTAQLVFVEVKFRTYSTQTIPEDAVDYHKMNRLKKAILSYLSQNHSENFRIDLVAIEHNTTKKTMKFRHHKAVDAIFY
jgi:putative endonuclease